MKQLFLMCLLALSVTACGKKELAIDDRVRDLESKPMYKCIEGSLYHRATGNIWIDKQQKCVVEP